MPSTWWAAFVVSPALVSQCFRSGVSHDPTCEKLFLRLWLARQTKCRANMVCGIVDVETLETARSQA